MSYLLIAVAVALFLLLIGFCVVAAVLHPDERKAWRACLALQMLLNLFTRR